MSRLVGDFNGGSRGDPDAPDGPMVAGSASFGAAPRPLPISVRADGILKLDPELKRGREHRRR